MVKEKIRTTDCDDASKYLEIFFRKVLLASHQNVFAVLFIYSKENCLIWHLLAIISALLDIVSSRVLAVLEYRHTHRLTHYWLKGDSLEFIVFITFKWSNFAGSSSSHNIT